VERLELSQDGSSASIGAVPDAHAHVDDRAAAVSVRLVRGQMGAQVSKRLQLDDCRQVFDAVF